jgi:F420-dependent oxidoreductase-like protein
MTKRLKLGYAAGYWTSGPPPDLAQTLAVAEDLGFDSFWTAEAYGSDCLTPLAWYGSQTKRMTLGTSIMQLSARTPAAAAMAAMTLDHLSGGRVVLGLGASGPQVVEGWYGRPYTRPLERTREYVEILRAIFAREKPVEYAGKQHQLPYPGGMGLGKPLKSTIHPRRTDIPIYLGAEGPKNVAMTAEIADGWLPVFFSPSMDTWYRNALAEGFARPNARRTLDDFEVPLALSIVVNDDVDAAANMVRPMLALYVGGMGAREMNFHYEVFARMGYEDVCAEIQRHFLAGDRAAAIAAVPTQMVEEIALVGPMDKIRDELPRWRDTVITSLLVGGPPQYLEQIAKVVW